MYAVCSVQCAIYCVYCAPVEHRQCARYGGIKVRNITVDWRVISSGGGGEHLRGRVHLSMVSSSTRSLHYSVVTTHEFK